MRVSPRTPSVAGDRPFMAVVGISTEALPASLIHGTLQAAVAGLPPQPRSASPPPGRHCGPRAGCGACWGGAALLPRPRDPPFRRSRRRRSSEPAIYRSPATQRCNGALHPFPEDLRLEVEESYKALGSAALEVAEFKNIAEEAFNAYFVSVAQLLSTGQFQTSVPDPVPSFPSMMIITAMPRHFAVELGGAQRDNRKLRIVSRKLDDPGVYFGQFNYPADAPPMVEMQAAGNGVAALALIPPDPMC